MTNEESDVIADKVVERLKAGATVPAWKVLNTSIIGNEMVVTATSPTGVLYQGRVTDWREVKATGVVA